MLLTGCSSAPVVLQGEGLGATWSVKLAGQPDLNATELQQGIQARVDDVSRHLSRWEAASSLNALNASSEEGWQSIPNELFTPLSYALTLAADTRGAFDPTVAPLVDVWGFGTKGRSFAPPSAEDLALARSRTGFGQVALDPAGSRVKRPPGVQIDLSSMTHGHAADRVATFLNERGVRNYLIDVGGELRARGRSPSGAEWQVALEAPPCEEGVKSTIPTRVVSLRDAGIATSGNYRYYFDFNGRRYSHRIDPRTGEPVSHALVSVTVIAPEAMQADALATALTVLGPHEGFRFASERRIAARFVMEIDDGLTERLTLRFSEYLN